MANLHGKLPRGKLFDHQIEFIRDNYYTMTYEQIAKVIKVHPQTVSRYRRKLGLKSKAATDAFKVSPDGKIVTSNSYQVIKANGKWQLLHRHVWEQVNGPIPPGHVIKFKDGDKRNCAIENLELTPKKKVAIENQMWNYPKEVTDLIILSSKVRRKINEQHRKIERGAV